MKLTDIKQQKNGRFAIYADGEYRLSVDKETLLYSSIERNGEITVSQLEELAQKERERTARERALTILSYRDHSKEELKKKLTRTVGEEEAEKAAKHMEEIGLINESEYADKLARELLSNRLMGAGRAVFEMKKRGIDAETAREVIEKFDDDTCERIKRFIEKKYPRGLEDEKERKRATQALLRNGFRWDDIKEALQSFNEDEY